MAYPKGAPKVGGRKKGTPNKLAGTVKDMILEALSDAGGAAYLLKQSEANPTAFMTLVGKVVPLQLGGDPDNPLEMNIRQIALVAGRKG